ncbi:OB-fold nucleic acid binding domain-containing protein, partial [Avibacterium avium]
SSRVAITKKGNRLGIATLDDRSGRLDLTLFGESLDRFGEKLQKDTIVIASGQVSFDDFSQGLKMSVRELMTLDEARSRYAKSLAICLTQEQLSPHFIKQFKETLSPYSGGALPINIYYQSPQGRALVKLGVQWSVNPSDELINTLVEMLGESAVEIEFK